MNSSIPELTSFDDFNKKSDLSYESIKHLGTKPCHNEYENNQSGIDNQGSFDDRGDISTIESKIPFPR